jgi:hypothetical protein
MYGYSWNMATYGSASGAGGATSNGGFGYGYHGRWEKYESGGYYENRPNSLQPENLVWNPIYSYRFIADTQNNGGDRRGYIAAVSRLIEMGGVQYSWEEALGVGRQAGGGPSPDPAKVGEWFARNFTDISDPVNYPGIKMYESKTDLVGGGVTLPGIGIFVYKGGSKDKGLLQHEYGHFLDYMFSGDINRPSMPGSPNIPIVSFYLMIGLPSLFNAGTGIGGDHGSYWTEVRANQWAEAWFGNNLSPDFGSGSNYRFPTK